MGLYTEYSENDPYVNGGLTNTLQYFGLPAYYTQAKGIQWIGDNNEVLMVEQYSSNKKLLWRNTSL